MPEPHEKINSFFLLLLIVTSALAMAYGITFNSMSCGVFGFFLLVGIVIHVIYEDFKNTFKRGKGA